MSSLDTLVKLAGSDDAEVRQAALTGLTDMLHRLEARQDTLEELMNSFFQLAHAESREEVLRLITHTAERAAKAEAATFFAYDATTHQFSFAVLTGSSQDKLLMKTLPAGEGIVGKVAKTREPVLALHAGDESVLSRTIAKDTGFVTRDIVAVPVLTREGDLLGVLEAVNKREGTFTQEDADILELLAQNISIAFRLNLI